MKPLPCPPSDWPRFSCLLDAYLELEPGQRAAWLDALPENDAPFKPSLQAVLSTGERRSGDWLDRPTGGVEVASPYVEGMRLGPWRLLRPLGSGGMGAVWLAARADGAYERQVALKLPHAHLLAGAQRERFQRERDILAGLTDPRIARFYDAGIGEDEQPWLALEYVEGTPITEHCASRACAACTAAATSRSSATRSRADSARPSQCSVIGVPCTYSSASQGCSCWPSSSSMPAS